MQVQQTRRIIPADIKRVYITREAVEYGKRISGSRKQGANFFRDQISSVMGFAAEYLFKRAFPIAKASEGQDVYNHDFTIHGCKIEIKNKICTTKPQLNHEGSTYGYNTELQKVDFYVFTRTLNDGGRDKPNFESGFIIGFISAEEFEKHKYQVRAGSEGSNGAVMAGDTWNVEYSKLFPIEYLESFCTLLAAERAKAAEVAKAN